MPGCPPGFCKSECTSLRSTSSGSGACKSVKIKVIHNYYSKLKIYVSKNKMVLISLSSIIGKYQEQFGKAFLNMN